MKLNNNDDSHNSGLNLLIYNMLLDIESHPTWVCGLKLINITTFRLTVGSHPTWVCGLKPQETFQTDDAQQSHPTWVCGLKQTSNPPLPLLRVVTPYVGVWIETCPRSLSPVR